MSTPVAQRARRSAAAQSDSDTLKLGSEVIRAEAAALAELAGKLTGSFAEAVRLLVALEGSLIVTGMGKAGIIGQKLAATFASTGTLAHFMHPAEAFHGDLGRVQPGDVVILLSQSGETSEVVQLLPSLRRTGVTMIAVTASRLSTLGSAAQVTIELGQLDEACSLGLAPSTSTTAMLALGDALALVVSKLKGFRAEDFAKYHPGGALGRKLSHVEDHMRPLAECRVARVDATLREVLVSCTKPGRRTGAIMLVDDAGKLTGLFTDSDLARLIERRHDDSLDRQVSELMITHPQTVPLGAKFTVAVDILSERKISELPVVDEAGKPVGLVDVTDLVGLLPDQANLATSPDAGPTIMRIYPADQYAD